MRYLSVCSGIEAASVAWEPLWWVPVAFSEIEPFPNAVLAHRFPDTPNWGNMESYKEWPDEAPDLLVGGTPCQSFSVAGLRAGLEDPRGNLALVYLGVVDRYRPRWIVWENVPGVLSSGGGRDFASFLGGLVELGYGFAYRVLDAQFFGVPQRRRRVFVVGHLGDWRPAAEVLFEPQSLFGHPPPSREAREGIAGEPAPRPGGDDEAGLIGSLCARDERGISTQFVNEGKVLPTAYCEAVSPALKARDYKSTAAERSGAAVVAFQANASASQSMNPSETAPSLDVGKAGAMAVTYDLYNVTAPINRQNRKSGDPAHTVARDNAEHAAIVRPGPAVRRLTPRECERLQGFPDDWTLVPHRGGLAKDGPRYRALGNSMAVPVMRWIGERIAAFESSLDP